MPFFKQIEDGRVINSNKKIIVFGNGGHARTIHGYFFDEKNVEGFVVDDQFVDVQPMIGSTTVYPFREINKRFPPSEYSVLVALGFKDMNELRMQKSIELRNLGYEFVGFIDKSVRVPSRFNVKSNAIIIGNADIHDGVSIGEGAFISSGAVLGHDSILGSYCWIGSGAVLAGMAHVGDCTVLGMNVSVGQNTSLAHHTLVSPNTFVNINTNPYCSVVSPSGKDVNVDSRKLHKFSYRK